LSASRLKSLIAPGFFALVGIAILVSLGIWQLERLQWKEALIARIDARIHSAPIPAPTEADWPRWNADADEYRPVSVRGAFLDEKTVFVTANAALERDGGATLGYMVLTPLQLSDGSSIIVNRGFVPMELKDQLKLIGEGEVTVTGLMRAPQEHGWFVPDDDPAKGHWFTRDPARIAAALGLARVAPFTIDRTAASGGGLPGSPWPRGGLTVVSFPNRHLEYAFTWFGLAATLLVVFASWAVRSVKDPES
jgi:surfeit locus 1 family protein